MTSPIGSFRNLFSSTFLAKLLLAASFCGVGSVSTAEPTTDKAELSAKAMDTSLSDSERVGYIKQLYPEMLVDGQFPKMKICIWDIVGKAGPIFNASQDQQTRFLDLGLNFELEAYTSESVLTEDLKAGQCDAALFTGLRSRFFNKFTGTIDSIGALPSSKHLKTLLKVLTLPKYADKMVEGPYVVMGYAPLGAAYIFVNDREINTLAKAAGKRVAVMDYDIVQAEMVQQIGASPVPTSAVSAGTKFNNNNVDVLPAPLVAYSVMELYKGIGDKGGIVNYPFSQLTLQLIGRTERIPNEIAQLVREDFYNQYDKMETIAAQQVGDIPETSWIEIPDADKEEYQVMMQEARIQLREREYYDSNMLTLQRKIRCKYEPSHFECAQPVE